ncbi:MAG TPA: hypothetical protein PLM57_14575, partial [Candidatus Latescibacteria bacterium]|nr:hypothetical protein [Candidatus Latescibacterota bacterium]
ETPAGSGGHPEVHAGREYLTGRGILPGIQALRTRRSGSLQKVGVARQAHLSSPVGAVIPAQAGIQPEAVGPEFPGSCAMVHTTRLAYSALAMPLVECVRPQTWIPACAGMTAFVRGPGAAYPAARA